MQMKKFLLASLLMTSLAFAQNATSATQWFSPYYPLINSPYLAGTIALVRDITIIVVLWMLIFKQFSFEKVK